LTKVGSQTITYDANGNPTNYLGAAATWEKGRQLKQYGANTYKYNNEGIRIQKTTSSEIHEYILDGTNIVKEIVTDIYNCPKYTNEYLYDLDGTVCGLKYNGTAYYFYKNLQGDVIAITDDKGETVARYTYDAWGKVLSVKDVNGNDITSATHVANINPFRYRGYYYDEEIELYYLQSRYYDANTGRFINEDDICFLRIVGALFGANLYAYCKNDPISNNDPMGYWYISLSTLWNILLAFAINPIASVLIGLGLWKLKAILVAKYTLLLAKLGAFWGPVVQVILVFVGAALGVPSIIDFAVALWDCVMQGKKGLEFTFKKTWFGMPYALDFYPA
jgi:RHS repeat-associated protein